MTLALPRSRLAARYDVIVIGSGYGGAIAACRAARAGRSVCILERGREYRSTDFPTTAASAVAEIQWTGRIRGRSLPRRNPLGLFDFRAHEELNALVGCGLGGTSLINAGVFLEPDPRVWEDPVWPTALRGDPDSVARGLSRARDVLEPKPSPITLHKKRVLGAIGEVTRVPILTHFDPPATNAAGVEERPCNGCGNCVSGCVYGSKKTVDRNYLPDAVNHGAQIFTEMAVSFVAKATDDTWAVHYRPVAPDIEKDLPFPFILADSVVFAAGVFGTVEILLRSRDRGLALSPALGSQFSGNGNLVGLAYGAGAPGASQGSQEPGPCIVGAVHVRGAQLDDDITIEDGVFPEALDLVVAAGALSDEIGRTKPSGLLERLGTRARSAAAVLAEQVVGAARDVQLLLVQGHDGARGRLTLDPADDRLSLSYARYEEHAHAHSVEDLLRDAFAKGENAAHLAKNPVSFGASHLTVHPLGGAPMGDDADVGVVDHLGRVFDPSGDLHRGLYVCDGSIIPRSLGTNPVATICALVERACEHIFVAASGTKTVTRISRGDVDASTGASFSEAFSGWASTGPRDPGAPDAEGRVTPLAQPAELRLVVSVEDVDAFLRDPRHAASAIGTFASPLLGDEPLAVVEGKIALFSDDPAERDTYYEVYDLGLVAKDGARYVFGAMKKFVDGGPLRVYGDGTTLPFTVTGSGVALSGVLTMSTRSLLSTIGTVSTHRASGVVDRLKNQALFRGFFARRWLERVKLVT